MRRQATLVIAACGAILLGGCAKKGDPFVPAYRVYIETYNADRDPVSELNKYRTADTGEIDTHELRYEYNEDGKCIRQETYDNDVLTEYVVMEYHYF